MGPPGRVELTDPVHLEQVSAMSVPSTLYTYVSTAGTATPPSASEIAGPG